MTDTFFLDYAASLASKIDPHRVAPNPRVGCVVVNQDKIIAEGVHERFGGGHAEVQALKGFDILPSDSIVYITLEPCDNFSGKKTPSCTQLLIKHKPQKVVVGMLDPQFQGKNLQTLNKAGINVQYKKHIPSEALNPFFTHFTQNRKPYMTLKVGQSLDGKITQPKNRETLYITNKASLQEVHGMRATYSAILTTVATINADNPRLDCRLDSACHPISHPDLIILGDRNKIRPDAKFFDIAPREIYFFESRDLKAIIQECGQRGLNSIMTECGQRMNTALLQARLVDEIRLFIAPKIIGHHQKNWGGKAFDFSDFSRMETYRLGDDLCLRYKIKNQRNVTANA